MAGLDSETFGWSRGSNACRRMNVSKPTGLSADGMINKRVNGVKDSSRELKIILNEVSELTGVNMKITSARVE